jgi:PAS domain S-box-containing protein
MLMTSRPASHERCSFASGRFGAWLDVPCNFNAATSPWRRGRVGEAYLAAVGLVAIATPVRVAIDAFTIGAQFPIFYLAVIGATFIGGMCVGLLTVVMSGLAEWFFLTPPYYSFTLPEGEAISLLTFGLTGTIVVFIVGSLQRAHARIEDADRRTIELEERARVIDELHHWPDAFQNAGFGMSIIDPMGETIRFANPAFLALHGMSAEDALGRSLYDFYLPADHDRVNEMKASVHKGHADIKISRVRKDGSVFPARVHVIGVQNANQELRYYISTVTDISHESRLEAELLQAQRLEAVGQLSAGIAHDFNNILQAIIAHLDLVDDDIENPVATRGHVERAICIAEQAGELVYRLLSFGRKQLLKPKAINLAEFFTEFHELISHTLSGRIKVETRVDPNLKPVWADPAQLQTAILNLAINARDAMPSGGNLRIESAGRAGTATGRIDDADRFAVIRVSDTGSGIAPEDLKKVCEPFFSTKGPSGTGLGLSMVYGFAKQSGGDLRITSDLGVGTCVEIWLPLSGSKPQPPPLAPPLAPPLPPTSTLPLASPSSRVRIPANDEPGDR